MGGFFQARQGKASQARPGKARQGDASKAEQLKAEELKKDKFSYKRPEQEREGECNMLSDSEVRGGRARDDAAPGAC